MIQKCNILDTTLREGEQTPGVLFSIEEKLAIVDGLAAIGIQEIEAGIGSPLMPCLAQVMDHCRSRHPDLATSIWCRCQADDIDYTATLKPDIIALSIPVSDLHLIGKLARSRNWAAETLTAAVARARAAGLRVSVGFEDATRADEDFLVQLASIAQTAGAFRLRIADTVGIASPGRIAELVARFVTRFPAMAIGVHSHNDFGMATANGISALENGALWVDTTILGLGERCGCARLEEIVAFLQLEGDDHHFQLTALRPLAEQVAHWAGREIPGNTPILGSKIFTCETGLHLQGLHRDPATYEPYGPEQVGSSRELLYGAKTGRSALLGLAAEAGIELSEATLDAKLAQIRTVAQSARQSLTCSELRKFLAQR
ncbi:MAG: pyruvate carboxyltransferase [Desulfopila sp.]